MTNRGTTGRKIFVNLSLCQLHKERLKSADLKTKALRVSARHPTSDILFLMIKWQFFVCTTGRRKWRVSRGWQHNTAQSHSSWTPPASISFPVCVILHCNSTTLNVFISSKECNCCMSQVISCYLVFALTHLLCRDGMDVEELRADGCLPRCGRQVDPRCWNIKRLVTINITPSPARPAVMDVIKEWEFLIT